MGRRCFFLGAFSGSMALPVGAAAWIGAGGEEVGASDGMVSGVSVLKLWPIWRPKLSAYGLIFRENNPLTQSVSK